MTGAAPARIGFISTRLAGTDGVSLEVRKWAAVLEGLGHQCFFFAGELDWPAGRRLLAPEAHFAHPEVLQINADLFDDGIRTAETSRQVQRIKELLKGQLYAFIASYKLHLLVAQNALAIPMNVPLGLALAEVIAETGIPTIGHHHDFSWERTRFTVSAAGDYLSAAFPPVLPSLRHVVINSVAGAQLAMRRGVGATLVPNVMHFELEPPDPDGYAVTLRADLGVAPDALLVLQPTRVVPRKRIERAIELLARLGQPATLLISHASGDEGDVYATYLREYAALLDVAVLFGSASIGDERGLGPDGRKIYSLGDVYGQCDLVTYPSAIEGFGNAFLEAIYYRRPLAMSAYEIFRADIQPKGFRVVAFEDFVTAETVRATQALLADQALVREIVEHNYALARRYYSYTALEKRLVALLNECLGA